MSECPTQPPPRMVCATASKQWLVVGIPNSGKSSIFTHLTGFRQKIANFPGVTVEKREGKFKWRDLEITLVDLPGIYGLTPFTHDQEVTISTLRAVSNHPSSGILYIFDAARPAQSLSLLLAIKELGMPVVVVFCKADTARNKNISISPEALAREVNLPVVEVNGRTGKGIAWLREMLYRLSTTPPPRAPARSGVPSCASCYMSASQTIIRLIGNEVFLPQSRLTRQLDRVLLHPFWGYVVVVVVLAILFQSIFWLAEPVMNTLDMFFGWLAASARTLPFPPIITSFLADGLVAGVGAVVVFLPQVAILFGLLTVLEDSGYMARMCVLLDNLMRRIGLEGVSAVPLVGGLACSVPAIMSARIVRGLRARLLTIFVVPLMSCSARLPVYVMLIGLLVPSSLKVMGVFNLQGILLTVVYTVGVVVTLGSALLVNTLTPRKRKSEELTSLVIELPDYQLPSLRLILTNMWQRMVVFCTQVGKIVIPAAVALWFIASIGWNGRLAPIEESIAASIGRAIEPAFSIMGFDWRICLGILTAFAGREVFISTLGILYGAGSDTPTDTLLAVLKQHAHLTIPTVIALLLFFAFAMLCMSTIAIARRESGSWRFTALQALYTTCLAYVLALAGYHIAAWLLQT